MSDIIVIEKPDYISYEQIHEVLEAAHKRNQISGFSMRTAKLKGEQLKKRIGNDGKCFVALDNDKLVGTISIRFVNRNKWYSKGVIPDYMLAGVIPEYQGKHINSMLANKVFKYSKERGYNIIELDTAENNTHAIAIYKHQGFVLVDYCAFEDVDHYSVVMAKWLNEKYPSKIYRKLRYGLKKIYVRIRYKIGGKKRFGL